MFFTMPTLIIAEKPSAAKDLAAVLGVTRKGEGFIETKEGVVTWGFGHLLENLAPEDYNEAWAAWSFKTLPIIPDEFKMQPKEDAAKQLRVILNLLKEAKEVVIATDADREGELIGREILTHAKYRGGIRRLWLTGLDPDSIRKAWAKLKPGESTAALATAAQARSIADWLVGMNMTRAMSLCFSTGKGDVVSIGRVQTPTVALVVRRDRAIKSFKSANYYELTANVIADGHTLKLRHAPGDAERYAVKGDADAIATAATGATGKLSVVTAAKRKGPKKLFDLGGLQKACNGLFGWSADKTLSVAQSLYETHKVTSYPRTDCCFLPEEQESDVPKIIEALREISAPAIAGFYKAGYDSAPEIRKSVFNTAKVTAHHAIIPLPVDVDVAGLPADDRKAYLLIAGRYLAALAPDMEYDETKVGLVVPVEGRSPVEFKATGRIVRVPGWTSIEGEDEDEDKKDEGAAKLPPVSDGDDAEVHSVAVDAKKTQPPKSYTEATLLADMESVAKFCEDPKLKAVLKESSGIGTPATRAAIIETVKKRGYLEVDGKRIVSTEKGQRIFDLLTAQFPAMIDPAETARWEDSLNAIAEGGDMQAFVSGIKGFVSEAVATLQKQDKPRGGGSGASGGPSSASAPRPEGQPTGITDPRTGSEFLDYGDYWESPKGVRCYKTISNRTMELADFIKIFGSKKRVEFEGFVSKTGKPFKAALEVVPDGKFHKVAFNFG